MLGEGQQATSVAHIRIRHNIRGGPSPIRGISEQEELIGRFFNGGSAWKQEPEKVFDHDFPSWALGKATPYGIYDLQANTSWGGLGLSHDAAHFAVDCFEAWWS